MAKRVILLFLSHVFAGAIGFAAGIYALPILIAPSAPDSMAIAEALEDSEFVGTFSRERADSDALHWGDGEISISADTITFLGRLAPGPDYKLYLSPEFVETEVEFNRLKPEMVQVGEVKTFENFIVQLSKDVNPADYTTLIVWCESFGQFITSGRYQKKADDA